MPFSALLRGWNKAFAGRYFNACLGLFQTSMFDTGAKQSLAGLHVDIGTNKFESCHLQLHRVFVSHYSCWLGFIFSEIDKSYKLFRLNKFIIYNYGIHWNINLQTR